MMLRTGRRTAELDVLQAIGRLCWFLKDERKEQVPEGGGSRRDSIDIGTGASRRLDGARIACRSHAHPDHREPSSISIRLLLPVWFEPWTSADRWNHCRKPLKRLRGPARPNSGGIERNRNNWIGSEGFALNATSGIGVRCAVHMPRRGSGRWGGQCIPTHSRGTRLPPFKGRLLSRCCHRSTTLVIRTQSFRYSLSGALVARLYPNLTAVRHGPTMRPSTEQSHRYSARGQPKFICGITRDRGTGKQR